MAKAILVEGVLTISRFKPKVLVAVGNFPPSHGGGGLRAYRMYKEAGEFFQIDLTAATNQGPEADEKDRVFDGIRVYTINGESPFLIIFLKLGLLFVTCSQKPFDLVHAMGFSKVANAAAIWALVFRIPLIREMTIDTPLPQNKGFFNKLIFRTFVDAKLLIAISENIYKRFRSQGISSKKIWIRPNPVDISYFKPTDYSFRAKTRKHLQLPDGKVLHLVLGRIQDRKNQTFALESIALLGKQHHLILAGPVYEQDKTYLSKIQEMLVKLGLSERVHIFPYQITDVVPLYNCADVLWVTSKKEGLPNVLLEALCCGLPCVVNKDLGLETYLENGRLGRCEELEPSKFSLAACQVALGLSSPEIRLEGAKIARKRYESAGINFLFGKILYDVICKSEDLDVTGKNLL